MIKRVLIANRGEIAVRIIKACRTMGISPVAVYSEADSKALHVQLADDAVLLGPPPPNESYLDIEKLINAAKSMDCDAIHPGYGFLSERANFARAVVDAGLIWVGPPAEAIDLLGDKVKSRIAMENAGVPVTPGFSSTDADIETYRVEGKKIGYPILIKAAAGGGGKGMRVLYDESGLEEAIEGARREALGAFGDGRIFIEKYVEKPRHVEFQIFADKHGNVVHLYERECSIQRRHQKVVEETPSTALTPEIRKKMGDAAIATAKAANYENAGTVEFLLDESGEFYFLEVNTRIQVEHPITEEVVGVDLVAEQFRIASGEKLQWTQDDLSQRGHAIEVRIYAEDPAAGFLPSGGPLLYLHEPTGPGVRIDGGVQQGVEIPIHYDPIMSKIITWGPDRESARKRMVDVLDEYIALGVPTTAQFLKDVMKSQPFIEGDTFTNFIDLYFKEWKAEVTELEPVALTAAVALSGKTKPTGNGVGETKMPSVGETIGAFRIGG